MTEQIMTVPAPDPFESRLAQMERWLEGYIDADGKRHPGLIEQVGKLYSELELRRERREAIGRVIASGSILAILGFGWNWFRMHVKW